MKRPQKLESPEIVERLKSLPGWTRKGDALHRAFSFHDFSEAFGWMTRCALVAEKLDHHPDWTNVYGSVAVSLSTHDAGGVTELDFRLAAEFDRLYDKA